jgi:hypothetical protein
MASSLNRWSLLRSNIVEALKVLPFENNVVIEKIAQPQGVWAIVGAAAIGVCRTGGRRTGAPEITYHLNQDSRMNFQLVVRADSAVDTTGALDEVGAAEDIAAIALAVRNVDVGIYGLGESLDTGGVFLDYLRDDVLVFPQREPGGAGPIALVITLETTDLPI